MKYVLACLLIILLLANCKKNASDCRLSRTDLFNGTTVFKSFIYEYDDFGRIQKITEQNPSVATVYRYYTDSVVALSNRDKHVYFLKNGLADTSSLTTLNHPFLSKYFYTYQYNSEGHLVSDRQIITELVNGNTIVDTIWHVYTILNDNLVKAVEMPSGDEIIFEYRDDLRPTNNFDLPVGSSKFSFLGKPSKNLPSKALRNGGTVYTMTYEYDDKGNISKYIASYGSPGLVYSYGYSYSCD